MSDSSIDQKKQSKAMSSADITTFTISLFYLLLKVLLHAYLGTSLLDQIYATKTPETFQKYFPTDETKMPYNGGATPSSPPTLWPMDRVAFPYTLYQSQPPRVHYNIYLQLLKEAGNGYLAYMGLTCMNAYINWRTLYGGALCTICQLEELLDKKMFERLVIFGISAAVIAFMVIPYGNLMVAAGLTLMGSVVNNVDTAFFLTLCPLGAAILCTAFIISNILMFFLSIPISIGIFILSIFLFILNLGFLGLIAGSIYVYAIGMLLLAPVILKKSVMPYLSTYALEIASIWLFFATGLTGAAFPDYKTSIQATGYAVTFVMVVYALMK